MDRIVLKDGTIINSGFIANNTREIFITIPGTDLASVLTAFSNSAKTQTMHCYKGDYKDTYTNFTDITSMSVDSDESVMCLTMSGTNTSHTSVLYDKIVMADDTIMDGATISGTTSSITVTVPGTDSDTVQAIFSITSKTSTMTAYHMNYTTVFKNFTTISSITTDSQNQCVLVTMTGTDTSIDSQNHSGGITIPSTILLDDDTEIEEGYISLNDDGQLLITIPATGMTTAQAMAIFSDSDKTNQMVCLVDSNDKHTYGNYTTVVSIGLDSDNNEIHICMTGDDTWHNDEYIGEEIDIPDAGEDPGSGSGSGGDDPGTGTGGEDPVDPGTEEPVPIEEELVNS